MALNICAWHLITRANNVILSGQTHMRPSRRKLLKLGASLSTIPVAAVWGAPARGAGSRAVAVQRLDRRWDLAIDPQNQGRDKQWFNQPPADARPAPVPGIVQQVFPKHHGVAWYFHRFTTALPAADQRAILRFGAVDYVADVWVNGQHVSFHEGGETPFTADVTGALRPNQPNLLAIRVLKPGFEPINGYRLSEIPHRNQTTYDRYTPGSGLATGGILLPVELHIVPMVRTTDVFAQADHQTGRVELRITVQNDGDRQGAGRISAEIALAPGGEMLAEAHGDISAPAGLSQHRLSLTVENPRLWSIDEPNLYCVAVVLSVGDDPNAVGHQYSVRFGFRDFRVIDGFFHLNGRRLFLKSTHTGNHFPIGHIVPPTPDLMRRDLLMAKVAGYNTVRFISGMPYPEQLDFCDEIGLMVYEENFASWLLGDSPKMAERFDRSTREMVLRDRNHPSVAIWGLLNETQDGAVFRRAVNALAIVRELDPTRLVLLGSGRWDAQPTIGSVSNPGSAKWEPVWGVEGDNAPKVNPALNWSPGGYVDRAGDAHVYPLLPLTREYRRMVRELGSKEKPVFLSEFGIGSQFNAIDELRDFARFTAPPDLLDRALLEGMSQRFIADLKRFGLDGVYPFPNDFFRESYRVHEHQRRIAFDLIRSNPNLCGYNLTGMLDHAYTGEGIWSFWRRWKGNIAKVMEDGFAPLRWCLFVEPTHAYSGRPIDLEAVLANEDILPPGEYPACFRISGRRASPGSTSPRCKSRSRLSPDIARRSRCQRSSNR